MAGVAFAIGWRCGADYSGRARRVREAAVSPARITGVARGHSVTTDAGAISSASPSARPVGEAASVAQLEELARQDPARAMAQAENATNLRRRDRLRQAVLRGWATVAPDAALRWAMTFTDLDNRPNIAAVLAGAATRPEEAVRIGREVIAGNPALALDYGEFLLEALANQGAFATAAQFASEDRSPNRAAWLNAAYDAWARNDPDAALAALPDVTDPATRTVARQGVMTGWAESNPKALAEYAARLPAGDERSFALSQALPQWVARDPAAASQWLERQGPDPTLDAGVIAIATMPALVSGRPEVSVEWAASITDPTAREGVLENIAEKWARTDEAAFTRFLAGASNLRPEDRVALTHGAQNSLNPPGKRG